MAVYIRCQTKTIPKINVLFWADGIRHTYISLQRNLWLSMSVSTWEYRSQARVTGASGWLFQPQFFILISYTPLSAKRINPQHQPRAPKSVPIADLKSLPRTWGHQGPWVFNHLIEQVVTAAGLTGGQGSGTGAGPRGDQSLAPGTELASYRMESPFLAGVTMNIKLSWQHASLSGFHNCSEYFRVLSFNLSLIKLVQ